MLINGTEIVLALGDRPMPRIGERLEVAPDTSGYIRKITWVIGPDTWDALVFLDDDKHSNA